MPPNWWDLPKVTVHRATARYPKDDQGIRGATILRTYSGAAIAAIALAFVGSVEPGWAQSASAPPTAVLTGEQLAARFGARPGIQSMSLSPDGTHVAMIVPAGAVQRVLVADMVKGGAPVAILATTKREEQLSGCTWPSDTRLLCKILVNTEFEGVRANYSRLIALDRDGSHVQTVTVPRSDRATRAVWNGGSVIDWAGDQPGQILLSRQFVPDEATGTHIASSDEGLGIESINITTMQRRVVEKARANAVDYIADGRGHVRIMGLERPTSSGYGSGVIDYYFRKADDRDWKPLGRLDGSDGSTQSGFEPRAVDPALDVVYGFAAGESGRTALVRVRLDGSGTREVVTARDDVDVDALVQIGRGQRVVGVSYATDRRQIEFFDPALRKLGAALGHALPGAPQISFVDSSADESRLLLFAGSDVDPGTFYLFDKTSHKLEPVLSSRPDLTGMALAPMKAVTFPAADGTAIPGYLTLPPGGSGKGLPAIVLPHGGPSARDEWGFDWLVQFFAARGFAVLQPNYRGSSGYGADWFLQNGFQSWPTAISDIDAGGRWLVAQGIAAPGKLAVVGWSYGGYAALQSGVTEPGLFKAIVAIAPVTDLERYRAERSNYTDAVLSDRRIGHGDHIRTGSPAQNAAAISVPVLLFHGDQDVNVAVEESRLMAERLRSAGKQVDFVEFKGLDHQLDDAAARTTLLSQTDVFLHRTLGMAP